MQVSAKVEWEPGAMEKLHGVPDKVMYEIARMTLDYSVPHMPKNTGKLRASSTGGATGGVKGQDGDYHIGSYTDYASKVWKKGSNTNWTTPDTYGHWYSTIWKSYGDSITKQAIERYKLK